jgi:glutamate-1-semialdehyde 2,1-aminomutase
MNFQSWLPGFLLLGAAVAIALGRPVRDRIRLSRAKHRSLTGHGRIARRLSRRLKAYEYDEQKAFAWDDPPTDVAARRRSSLIALGQQLKARAPLSLAAGAAMGPDVSDLQFTNANRVPFQFRRLVAEHLPVTAVADATDGVRLRDLDGNWAYDVSGSYGVNLLGYEAYKEFMARGAVRAQALGPVLGPYHPVVAENAAMLRAVSGLDEVSFHMSGTEAVMQAVRLARYHTRRRKLVMFCGAYHGWWDGVQPGAGNPQHPRDVLLLAEQSERSLAVLRSRRDIACVLINPLQCLDPNAAARSDATLIAGRTGAVFNKDPYVDWLKTLREVCRERGIALIFDEVFVGFRLAPGGAQEYFGVQADLVTYGKTVGGGLPVGVLCGRRELMKRYRDDFPSDLCFARGTFNSHPYVMTAMNEFLRHVTTPAYREAAAGTEALWNQRFAGLNQRLTESSFPLQLRNLVSICTVDYTRPGRYHWMLQYYLRAEGLQLSWIGTGRLIFSHDYTDEDFQEVTERFLRAAARMDADGWWWHDGSLSRRIIGRRILGEVLRAAH